MTELQQQPEPAEDTSKHRAIKSFVMRAGRMTEGQQRGLDQGWPKFGLQLEDGLRDFDQVFGRTAPRTFGPKPISSARSIASWNERPFAS